MCSFRLEPLKTHPQRAVSRHAPLVGIFEFTLNVFELHAASFNFNLQAFHFLSRPSRLSLSLLPRPSELQKFFMTRSHAVAINILLQRLIFRRKFELSLASSSCDFS